ncbi:site-specific integrase [Shewanella sp. GutDb-MelDb]|uniref:tyrosine-type recombinase/integrase n=1 Tax=Shewanella sp. GutDb-MelDb TaxID=2058316 RepID=UPI000C7BCCE1|nr:site-specific integrase [Shewanella sp. GutDb-MelDb]PKG56176.1 integrase [Shewanella sp. GutDb-MelDb]
MLYETSLRALNGKAQPKVLEQSDGKGLGVRISKLGKVRFQYRYKINDKNKRMDLGDYPDLSLRAARDAAEECRTWLAEGHDPKIKRSMGREKTLAPVTVQQALEYWIENYARDSRANVEKNIAQFQRHIYPYIGHFPLEQTEIRHWIECFDRIRRGIKGKQRPAPVAVGQILQNAKQALRFCRVRHYAISRELDDLTTIDVGKRQRKKDRVLSDVELYDLLNSIQRKESSFYMRYLCQLLIVFGARTQELRLSTFDEWDLDLNLWTVPKAHSKTGTVIIRPIPVKVKPIIEFLYKRHGKEGYLLGELKKGETVSGSGSIVHKRLKHKESWSLHDLRRTFTTKLNDLGVAPYVVEQLLGHSLGGVMAIYNRSQYLPEKRIALDMWCEWLELLINPSDNVVLIGAARQSIGST